MKTAQKRVLSQHGAVEVRLNRALEDVERYKDAHQKAKTDAKVSPPSGGDTPSTHCVLLSGVREGGEAEGG